MDYRAELERAQKTLKELHERRDRNSDELYRLHRELGEKLKESLELDREHLKLSTRLDLLVERAKV